jgi:hypothetical protein
MGGGPQFRHILAYYNVVCQENFYLALEVICEEVICFKSIFRGI